MKTAVREVATVAAGIGWCAAAAAAAMWLAARLALPVPGQVLAMTGYAALLAAGRLRWSRPGATLLARWIGALLVPALVGLQAYVVPFAGVIAPLAAVLVVTTLATGLATAWLYRLAGGR